MPIWIASSPTAICRRKPLWGESRKLVEPVLQNRLEAFLEAMEGYNFEAALQLLREAVATKNEAITRKGAKDS